jgi:hypothetical protein
MGVRPRRETVDINGALKGTSVEKKGRFTRGHGRMQEMGVGTLNAVP